MSDRDKLFVARAFRPKGASGVGRQPLEEHLRQVAALTEASAAKAGLPMAGRLLGLLHDFGKYSEEFQRYILSAGGAFEPGDPDYVDPVANKGKINHAFAGGQFIWRRLQGNTYKRALAQMLALCALSHHCGLKDCFTPEAKNAFVDDYMARSEEKTHHDQCERVCDPSHAAEIDGLIGDALTLEFLAALKILRSRVVARQPQNASDAQQEHVENSRDFQHGLLTRFLFGCLVDADRTNSAECEDPALKKLREDIPRRPWETLASRLEAALAAKKPQRPIDRLRREISDHCARRALDDRGIFTLTVPTGVTSVKVV